LATVLRDAESPFERPVLQIGTGERSEALARVASGVGYRSLRRYEARCNFVFKGVPLAGARVLDVGCGSGALSLWAALHGASYVQGLEPAAAGSTTEAIAIFRRLANELQLGDRLSIRTTRLEDETLASTPFDVAVLYNVINHINESAVCRLHEDESAVRVYVSILRQLQRLLARDAWVIVADCGRRNLWNQLSLRSPLAPTIEWHKHQEPETWTRCFSEAGYQLVDLRWSPLYPFGRLSSNHLVQYLTASHFVLRFRSGGRASHLALATTQAAERTANDGQPRSTPSHAPPSKRRT
jgi:SAM-dependent methyltransferase